MPSRHHLTDCDRGRAVGRLTGSRLKCHYCSCFNGCIKEGHLAMKKGCWRRKCFSKACRGRGRNTTPLGSLCSSREKKEQKFHSWPDICKPCNRYRYACIISRRLNG
ncbi:hypothetical protein TNCV_2025191 [Trichonephila clavipes]|nr:hypothetical protein TNCV_2025191 [Trichonephila clavipes]